MSYTTSAAVATCTVPDLSSVEEAALAVYDYCVNHPDEIPESLDEYDSDDFVSAIESYLDFDDQESLVISYDSEADGNSCAEVFDFLASHFACLQSSPFMEVSWSSFDSRRGTQGGTDYYNRAGELIDVRAVLTAHFTSV